MTAYSEAFQREVARVARKEVRGEISSLRKQSAQTRAEVTALRKTLKEAIAHIKHLEKAFNQMASSSRVTKVEEAEQVEKGKRKRAFSAEALARKRSALGLSQQEMAALAGCSVVSLHRWEHGLAQPRAAQQDALKQVMAMGKREAAARLAELSQHN